MQLAEKQLSVLEGSKLGHQGDHQRIDVIKLDLRRKNDDMVALFKTEQLDDNDKKEYCEMQFDNADDSNVPRASSQPPWH